MRENVREVRGPRGGRGMRGGPKAANPVKSLKRQFMGLKNIA